MKKSSLGFEPISPAQYGLKPDEEIDSFFEQLEEPGLEVAESGGACISYVSLRNPDRAAQVLNNLQTTQWIEPAAIGLSSNPHDNYYSRLRKKRSLLGTPVILGNPLAVQAVLLARQAISGTLGRGAAERAISRISPHAPGISGILEWQYTRLNNPKDITRFDECLSNGNAIVIANVQMEPEASDMDLLEAIEQAVQTHCMSSGANEMVLCMVTSSNADASAEPIKRLIELAKQRDDMTVDEFPPQGYFFFRMGNGRNALIDLLALTKGFGYKRNLLRYNGGLGNSIQDAVNERAVQSEPLRLLIDGQDVPVSVSMRQSLSSEERQEIIDLYKRCFGKQQDVTTFIANKYDPDSLSDVLDDPDTVITTIENKGRVIGFFLGGKDLNHGVNHFHTVNPRLKIDGVPVGEMNDLLYTYTIGIDPDYQDRFGELNFMLTLLYILKSTNSTIFGGDVAFSWGNGPLMNLGRALGAEKQWSDCAVGHAILVSQR